MKTALTILVVLCLLGVAAMAVFVYVIQNVETPSYSVLVRDGAIEVRDYPPLVVAEAQRRGSRQGALGQSFRLLAGYIFAKERGGSRIAMTAPVTQQRTDASPALGEPAAAQGQDATEDGPWAVRFIMPSAYRLEDLPPPAGTEVHLAQAPARRSAAIRFSGRATDAMLAEKERELRNWIQTRGLKPNGTPVYAFYNDPFTPGPLRRNEVLIDLAPESLPEKAEP